ncbi:MarR family transcriptional regulator [Azospirillum thiophilum]|uniref:MarR family transcriptional regulator n=2 Tax=Azospirillum thiophilum TaxID=528244 RepID=A0AAC8W3G8_9PROT|nr:MarR family transcriptional regulator [Azospirillum thiophilum]ALG74403.1 MarR family transcriptional regulator [Azospirillum thiophilum]KJR63961.1 MarR family transcriptional regulator [Azospirillum thiophilum]
MTLGAVLNDTARLMRVRFDQRARHLGLTRAQWSVIATLARNEGIRQTALADLLEIEPITLCRQIDRMEEGGWIERHPDPSDRRARLPRLTPKAHAVLERGRAVATGIYAEALSGLPPDAEAQLVEMLAHMRANLSDRRADSAEKAAAKS